MNNYRSAPCLKYGLGVAFVLGLIGIAPLPGMAQITPDETLGNERSQVNRHVQVRGGDADRIEGGATRGANLFHSFREFNVNEGQRVYFANPAGVANILSRVTGRDVSDIMGTLGVEGGANLFLLNPNGIIFGPNARLDISGSFVGSTANSFTFPDGTEFSATNPGDSSLLSVNVPLGVQYGPGQRGNITNAGNLAVNPGQGITLYGGTVISSGSLTAPGGTVQVLGDRVALTDNARIDVSGETGGGTVLVGGDYRGQGTVPNALRTFVGPDVTINADALSSGNGGRVIVWADEATGFYGAINARGGRAFGNGGFVEISGAENLAFNGAVDVGASVGTPGTVLFDPRDINIVAGGGINDDALNDASIFLAEGGENVDFQISDTALESITAGTIMLRASRNINFDVQTSLRPGLRLFADAGNNIQVNQEIFSNGRAIELRAGSNIAINNSIKSNGGLISLNAPEITVARVLDSLDNNQAILSNGGAINLSANSDIQINGGILSNGGLISLNAPEITVARVLDSLDNNQAILSNGGAINLSANSDIQINGGISSSGGDILLTADRITVSPVEGQTAPVVQTTSESTTPSGNLAINTRELRILNGGQVSVDTRNAQNAGDIDIQATDLVEVSGLATDSTGTVVLNSDNDPVSSTLGTQVKEGATGDGGNLTINTGTLRISNGGLVTASTFSSGDAGDIDIQATDLVEVSGLATDSTGVVRNSRHEPVSSILSVQVEDREAATGDGGNLTIDTGTLRISNGGLVTASTFSHGDAGDIDIQATDLVEVSGLATDSTGTVVLNSRHEPVSSILRTQVEDRERATGDGGNLTIDTGTLRISNGGLVTASTFSHGDAGVSHGDAGVSHGDAGDIDILAADLVEVSGLATDSTGVVRNSRHEPVSSILSVQVGDRPGATGDGGNLTIDTGTLRISDGGLVTASTFSSGDAGDIDIQAADLVEVSGLATDSTGREVRNSDNDPVSSILRTQVEEGATGDGGNLTIDTGTLRISDGGLVTASTFSSGDAGDIDIQAADLVEVSGLATDSTRREVRNSDNDPVPSILRTQVEDRERATGDGGNLTIDTGTLRISDGGLVTASTFSQGDAGRIYITADDSLRLSNEGRLSAESMGNGEAGSIEITTDELHLQDDSRITVSNEDGVAGNLNITADSVTLDNSRLEAIAGGGRDDDVGNVTLTVRGTLLRLQNDTQEELISARASGDANGSNVTLNVRDGFVLANPYENSDIVADAQGGNGGNIQIDTLGIFGLEERNPREASLSDINASSEFGLDGEIVLNTLGIDPTRGLGELPIEIFDASDLVAEGCVGSNRRGNETQGQFTRSGRGGLSPDPTGILSDDSLIDQSAPADTTNPSSTVSSNTSETSDQPPIEAQGLASVNGKVSLVAGSSTSTLPSPVFAPNTCDAP